MDALGKEFWLKKAPVWADCYDPVSERFFFNRDGAACFFNDRNYWMIDARISRGRLARMVKRPLSPNLPSWAGPSDGFPPVGSVVEVQFFGAWVKATFVGGSCKGSTDAELVGVFECEGEQILRLPMTDEKVRAIDNDRAAAIKAIKLAQLENEGELAEYMADRGWRVVKDKEGFKAALSSASPLLSLSDGIAEELYSKGFRVLDHD